MARTLASREVVRVQLADDWWVELKAELSYGDRQTLRKMLAKNPQQAEWGLLETAVTAWDLEDGKGGIAPIKAETIEAMREGDVILLANALAKQYAGLSEESKKA